MVAIQIILAIIPSLIVGIALAVFNKLYNKKSQEVDKRAEMRKQESLLSLKFASANGALCYAVAMAVKRGAPNGEIEEGIKQYDKAKKDYYDFINDAYFKNMQ